MPIDIKQLPGESIISITISRPFSPERDIPAMFAEIIQLRHTIQGDSVQIIDMSSTMDEPNTFSKMVIALAEASQGIRASKAVGLKPPITIFVGAGPVADIASKALKQEQYGGVGAHLCASYEEALIMAREKLAGIV